MEPFIGYMGLWEKQKNGADVEIAKAKAHLDAMYFDQENEERLKGEIKKATFNRAQSKLFANSLPGRNNIKIDRPQTMLTKSANDVVCLLGDGVSFHDVQLDSFILGGQEWWRAKYHEGDYADHVSRFRVCPYLSGYMLAYSKNAYAVLLSVPCEDRGGAADDIY